MPKVTIKSLTAELDALKKNYDVSRTQLSDAKSELSGARERAAQLVKQFDDLKRRVSDAEMENQRLRGYVQRVQEDDVVREELITTGDPEGEQRMVPKRSPTRFEQPSQCSPVGELDDRFYRSLNNDEPRRKSKHWISYGTR